MDLRGLGMDPGALGVDLGALGFHLGGLGVDLGFSTSESWCSESGFGLWEWILSPWE